MRYATQGSKLASLDVGDTLGEKKVFRVNLLSDRGESYVDLSRLERTLLRLALDFQPTDSVKLELNASRYHNVDMGFPGTFSLGNNQTTPDPKYTSVELLPQVAVHADYGLSVVTHRGEALRFALFVMSPEAQHVIATYGFTPVGERYATL